MRYVIGFFLMVLFPAVAMAEEKGGVAPHMMWRIIDFVIFVAIIYYFLRKPIANFFRERRESILRAFEEAEKLRLEAERLLKETEEKLAKLDEEVERIISTFRAMAESEKESILKEMEEALQRIRESIEEEKRSLVSKAKGELLKLMALNAVKKVRERLSKLSGEEHAKINRKFIRSISQ